MRTESAGYRRDHLRALAQRVEVDAKEVRIMCSKSVLLRTLVAASEHEIERLASQIGDILRKGAPEPAIPRGAVFRRVPRTAITSWLNSMAGARPAAAANSVPVTSPPSRSEHPATGATMTHLLTARRAALATTFLIVLAGAALAQQKISVPSVTPASLTQLVHHQAPEATVSGELYMPPKASGPVPAMVLKHGSGGLQGPTGANIRKWAATFTGWGIAAFLVDSFGPRGMSSSVADQTKVSSWADVADALSALKVLGADPRIDKTRIGIIGWSRGGGVAWKTSLETIRKSVITDDLKFALHIVFYGDAEFQYRDRATDQSPMLFLHGESDNYVEIGPMREFADWAQGKGSPVTFISYPKTFHDFDVQGSNGVVKEAQVFTKCDMVVDLATGRVVRLNHADNPTTTPEQIAAYSKSCMTHGPTISYNANARSDAVEKVREFLKQNFQL
jgi:dienelactone hydrolase